MSKNNAFLLYDQKKKTYQAQATLLQGLWNTQLN